MYLLFSGFGLVAQCFCGVIIFAFHLAVLIDYWHTLSFDMKIAIGMTIILNWARFFVHLPLFFVAYDLGYEVRNIDPTPEGPDYVPAGFDSKPAGRIRLPPGPARLIYIRPVQDDKKSPKKSFGQQGDQPTKAHSV